MKRHVAQQLLDELTKRQQTLAIAESCTGGLVSVKFTDVPGSSAAFLGGAITYSNQAKIDILRVSERVLEQHGAVSEEVAALMALGVKHKFGSDWAISTTGIAGPSGGTRDKPVGTICLGLTGADGAITRMHHLKNLSREQYRETVAEMVLEWLFSIVTKHT